MIYVHELSESERHNVVEALEHWDDAAEVRRVRAIRLSDKGWNVPDIAEALDVSRKSVRNWINWYEEGGLEALRTDDRPGRPPRVDQHYRDLLAETVETPPRDMGYQFSRWTRKRLAKHMEEKTGISITPRYVSELLHQMEYVYKRPKHDLSHKRDEESYEKKKEELEELKKGPSARHPTTG